MRYKAYNKWYQREEILAATDSLGIWIGIRTSRATTAMIGSLAILYIIVHLFVFELIFNFGKPTRSTCVALVHMISRPIIRWWGPWRHTSSLRT